MKSIKVFHPLVFFASIILDLMTHLVKGHLSYVDDIAKLTQMIDEIEDDLYLNGKEHGHGIYKYDNGDIYEGEWKDNMRNGHGIYVFTEGDIYEGEYKDDKISGYGILKYASGDVYEGE